MVQRHFLLLVLGGALALAAALLRPAAAQPPRRQPTPNDQLLSPQVLSDRKVTFRIYAPKASEVSLRGDWMAGVRASPAPQRQGGRLVGHRRTARARLL